MVFARAISSHRNEDIELAFARMKLPTGAREYLLEKIPASAILLTHLTREQARFLRGKAEQQNVPGVEEYPLFIAGNLSQRPGTALLSGRREQFERIIQGCEKQPDLIPLAQALSAALKALKDRPVLMLGSRPWELGVRTYVMGVVNVTPNSFSDGGQFLAPKDAIEHGLALVQAGADILDVGGESSRPGAVGVTAQEELERVLPVVRGLKSKSNVPISVDTMKSEVAHAALSEGAVLVNDVSAFQMDVQMAQTVAAHKAACCLSHMQGTPRDMQINPHYTDAVEEIFFALESAVQKAEGAGIPKTQILVDPGIGFGKNLDHNIFILRRLFDFRLLGCPILVGTSRKAFLGTLAGRKTPRDRLAATLGSIAAVAAQGLADIVRVHDVAEAKDALAVADAIRQAHKGGEYY